MTPTVTIQSVLPAQGYEAVFKVENPRFWQLKTRTSRLLCWAMVQEVNDLGTYNEIHGVCLDEHGMPKRACTLPGFLCYKICS
jgi:hypothetical protein